MEKSNTYRSSNSPRVILWTPSVRVFLCLYLVVLVTSKVAPPTERVVLVNGHGNYFQFSKDDKDEDSGSTEVSLGESSLHSEIIHTQSEHPVMKPTILETHPYSIKERSAPDECQLLKKIRDDSKNGASIFSLGVLRYVIIVIQRFPRSTSLRYLCADGILSADLANFSSAESSCSLRNITTVNGDNITDLNISEPSWINYETMDRQGMYWIEMSTQMDSCNKIKSSQRNEASDVDHNQGPSTNSTLHKTIRIIKYENFTQIRSCCEGLSIVPTTESIHTTPKDKVSRTDTAITILIIFIVAVFTVVCLVFLACKVCCRPKRRPSYKVEYADPSDVIASSSGAEYSTPYDTCKARNKVVKVTAASRGASGRKPKVSLRKKLSQKFGSSRSRRRRRENDSGFSDLLESDGSKMSGRGDQMDAKEGQYMEIPFVNVPVSKSCDNASYTSVEGKQNGHKLALSIQELKEKQKASEFFVLEKSEDPYESLPDNDTNNHPCDAANSVLDRNAAENPYAIPDCEAFKKYPIKTQGIGSSYAQIKHAPEEAGGATIKRFNKGQEENHYM